MSKTRLTIRIEDDIAERMEALAFLLGWSVNGLWSRAAEALVRDYQPQIEGALSVRRHAQAAAPEGEGARA